MAKQSYPLCWPDGWKRTDPSRRVNGKFGNRETKYVNPTTPGVPGYSYKRNNPVTVRDSVTRLLKQLEMMGVQPGDAIVSTNIGPKLDGMPRSGAKEPTDPGAAVYWQDFNQQRCMAIDRYASVADNLAAIAATLEAMRAIERHGGAEILTRAFLGFAALPEKTTQAWREVFGFSESEPVSADQVKSKYRELAKRFHPDNQETGDRDQFDTVTLAYANASTEISV